MRVAVCVLWLLAAVVLADDPEPKDARASKPRELDVKALKITAKPSRPVKPTKIASAKELADVVSDKDAQATITKQVDFKKEYLLLFAWAGSGGDRLSFEVKKTDKGEEVVFTMKRGLTRDLRRHVKLYAIPAKVGHRLAE
jgi:hypothetical protein